MNKELLLNKLKAFVPHAIVVAIFLVISMVYFYPLLEGKKISHQHDIKMANGMSKELGDFRAKNGSEALWTNSIFGGMPAYQISVVYKNNITNFFHKVFTNNLPIPARFLFLSLVGFYILLLVFGISVWLAFAGAIAFAFSSYFFIIVGAGHNTKALALTFMAPIIAGFLLSFRGKYILGGIVAAICLALQISANHPQITYYTFIVVFVLGIIEFSFAIQNKELPKFVKSATTLLAAIIIAVGVNFTSLFLTYEYSKSTIRGKSELTSDQTDKTQGLDRSYILSYSYGIAETFDLFIPNFVAAGKYDLDTKSETYKYLVGMNYGEADSFIKQLPLYWGPQAGTSGPVYIGAVIMFLFVLGCIVVRGRLKWWLVSVTVLSILLAWGKNFEFFSSLFIDYFPLYNKFRTVSMILVIAEFAIPLLGILGLWKLFSDELQPNEKMKGLYYATAISAGIAFIFWALPSIFFNFEGGYDAQLKASGWPEPLLDALRMDRKAIMQADSLRTLIFVIVSAGVVWAFLKNKLSAKLTAVAFSVLFIIDLGFVNVRYFNSKNFSTKHEVATQFQPSVADQFILNDPSLDYRVANLSVDMFNDASTSYYHKSIGGYHGAKLKRYQELIERHISQDIARLQSTFGNKPTAQTIDSIMSQLGVVNMLNTKYFIYNPEATPLVNNYAFGNAWFVNSTKIVKNADEEIAVLGQVNLKTEVVVDQRFESELKGVAIQPDAAAQIKLETYEPNHLTYKTSAKTNQIAVFSEIYYADGWNAYIDGKLAPHFRANYVLRAMNVPAGNHTIEYRFEPKAFMMGERISLASSALLVLLIVAASGFGIYRMTKEEKVA